MDAPVNKLRPVLKQRLLTTLVLIPPVVAGVLWLPHPMFSLFFAVPVLAAAWEWAALCGLNRPMQRFFVSAGLAGLLWLLYFSLSHGATIHSVLVTVLGVWIGVLIWLANPGYVGHPSLKILLGFIILGCAWGSVIWLHAMGERGPLWVLYLLVLVWVADSGAYFTGRRFGKHRLAPRISPGKTREGAYGALVLAFLYSLCIGIFMQVSSLASFIVLSKMVTPVGLDDSSAIGRLKVLATSICRPGTREPRPTSHRSGPEPRHVRETAFRCL